MSELYKLLLAFEGIHCASRAQQYCNASNPGKRKYAPEHIANMVDDYRGHRTSMAKTD